MIPALCRYQPVRIVDRAASGHVRTPGYLRGRRGRILEVVGAFPDPTSLARGELGLPYGMLYRVVFRAGDVWPNYAGAPGDEIVADLYEPWLEASEEDDG